MLETAAVRNWKPPIAFALFTIIALVLFVWNARPGVTTYPLSTEKDLIQLAPLVANALIVGIVVTIVLFAITIYAAVQSYLAKKTPLWLTSLFAILFFVGFLTWAGAGATIPLPNLLVGAVGLSTPLIFGALGGVLSERVGVVNVAIEGQLLAGAFSSAVAGSLLFPMINSALLPLFADEAAAKPTAATIAGLLALIPAIIAGMMVSFVLAAFSIKYIVDQVIVGVVLNVLVLGLTSFLFSTLLSPNKALLNTPERFPRIEIPGLSQIPIIGPVFFRQTIIIYLMYIAVAVVWFALFKTRWGLRLRAVGEHPQAADTVGIKVNPTRMSVVLIAGAIAGLGGAFFTLGSVGAFGKEMTAGAGFIALAAVIFGRWDPLRATLAALLFGFASNLQSVLSIIGSPVPSEFMLMLPYLVTIFAVAGLVGQVRGPAAAGKPYVKS